MLKLYENIKNLRLREGLTQEELARKTGYTDRSSIAKIERGSVDLSQTKIKQFAEALGVTPGQLMGWDDQTEGNAILPLPPTYSVPLIGAIACGEPITAEENQEGEVAVPDQIRADFALRCKGDSMIGARIHDGDIVYIRQQSVVESGEIAAVLIGTEATLKRVRIFSDRVVLEPANPAYEPLMFSAADMDNVRIIGKAVAFTSIIK